MDQVSLTPVAQTSEWPASTPDAEGLDPEVLTDLVRKLRRGEFGSVSSVLIVRNDRLVLEEYNNQTSSRAQCLLHACAGVDQEIGLSPPSNRGRQRMRGSLTGPSGYTDAVLT